MRRSSGSGTMKVNGLSRVKLIWKTKLRDHRNGIMSLAATSSARVSSARLAHPEKGPYIEERRPTPHATYPDRDANAVKDRTRASARQAGNASLCHRNHWPASHGCLRRTQPRYSAGLGCRARAQSEPLRRGAAICDDPHTAYGEKRVAGRLAS